MGEARWGWVFYSDHDFWGSKTGFRAQRQEETVTTVDCAIGSLACRKRADMKPGDKATLSLRPEFIRLKRGDASEAQNVFNGQIQSLVFIGEAFEGEITIHDSQLFIKTEPDSDIRVGDSAYFTVDPDHCLLVTR